MGRDDLVAELDRIVERLRKDGGVRLVLLFGSMARGEIHSGSDIDLIVVKETDERFLDRLDEFYVDATEPMDVLVYTPEEYESMKWRPFLRRAIEEGVVLYEA
ncbi:MAG: nucleotidyltransferase domain-containing protein [Methanotrichaceae archaeon]|nr:nucleotidyltransferase domain-containing protein [Methanotrichaceae archaeon]